MFVYSPYWLNEHDNIKRVNEADQYQVYPLDFHSLKSLGYDIGQPEDWNGFDYVDQNTAPID